MNNRLPKTFVNGGATNGRHSGGRTADFTSQSFVRSTGRQAFRAAGRSIGAYPVVSLAAAFVTGIILGKWIKK